MLFTASVAALTLAEAALLSRWWGWAGSVALAVAVLALLLAQRRRLQESQARAGAESRSEPRRSGLRAGGISPRLSGMPTPLVAFAGRRHELEALLTRFRELRKPDAADGAIILAIHGMPGVGKSTLAHELARQLMGEFGDGALFANLGNAGNIRAEADILNRFLMALGVPKDEIPQHTRGRAALFRSATATKQILVVLDAARDHQQVNRLLPAAKGCAVIVTSRRDLSPALGIQPYPLALPEVDGALEMLLAVSAPWSIEDVPAGYDYESAVEIVNTLGRLPLAISAVGDQVVQRAESLREVADRLRERSAVETMLRNNGRGIEERIGTEYDRLPAAEQEAFRLLSLLEGGSFVPWALVPLVGDDDRLNYLEAEKLISRLAERQLLEPAGRDAVTGLDRYRFHPITRIIAEHLREREEAGSAAALSRVDNAYLEAVDVILEAGDAQYREESGGALPRRWFTARLRFSKNIGELPQGWVRAEYRNLLRCVSAAHAQELWSLCWRVAARLGDCVPDNTGADEVEHAFQLALEACAQIPDRHASRRGQAEVLLARADYRARRQSYSDAYDSFHQAAAVANHLRPLETFGRVAEPNPHRRAATGIECEAYRRLAAAHLRLGMHREALFELVRAERLARLGDEQRCLRLITLMRAHIQPGVDVAGLDGGVVDDEIYLWHESALAEADRRVGHFKAASDRLRRLRHHFEEDLALGSELLTRMADLRLDEHRFGQPPDPEHTMHRALRRAAEALYGYKRIGDRIGIVRVRCLLVRALVRLHQLKEAEAQMDLVRHDFDKVDIVVRHSLSTLRAAIRRAGGELLLERSDGQDGRQHLLEAARLYHAHGDGQTGDMVREGSVELGYDGGPVRRLPAVTVEGELQTGRPLHVEYSVQAPPLMPGRFPVGSRYIRVLVVAAHADVEPPEHQARLDAWAPLGPLRFVVTPRSPGILVIGFYVYDADDGSLLLHGELNPREITGAALEDAAQ